MKDPNTHKEHLLNVLRNVAEDYEKLAGGNSPGLNKNVLLIKAAAIRDLITIFGAAQITFLERDYDEIAPTVERLNRERNERRNSND